MPFQKDGNDYTPQINGVEANEVQINGQTIWTADSGPTVLDDFEGGVSSAWTNNADHGTTTNGAFNGSEAAYRVSGGSWLMADDTAFAETMAQDNGFISLAGRAPSTPSGYHSIGFAADSADSSVGRYAVDANFDNNSFRVRHRDDVGNWNNLGAASFTPTGGEWYDIVVCWTAEDTLHAWLYDGSGTEVAHVETDGTGETGNWWMVVPSPEGSSGTLIDYVRHSVEHPYTGQHYSDVSYDQPTEDVYIDVTNHSSIDAAYDHHGDGSNTVYRDSTYATAQTHSARCDTSAGNTGQVNAFIYTDNRGFNDPHEACHQVNVRLSDNYEFTNQYDNCRISCDGLSREYGSAGSGGGTPSGDDGWSVRAYAMAQQDNDTGPFGINMYIYHMDKSSNYGDNHRVTQDLLYPGQWHEYTCYVKLNTISNGTANYDGIVRAFVDGEEFFYRDDLRWTTMEEQQHHELGLANRWGGTETPPVNTSISWDEDKYWFGSNIPAEYKP